MITITQETWDDLQSNMAATGLFEQFKDLAIEAINAGVPVMITDENGQNSVPIIEQDGNIFPEH
jgi:hypothetical protein